MLWYKTLSVANVTWVHNGTRVKGYSKPNILVLRKPLRNVLIAVISERKTCEIFLRIKDVFVFETLFLGFSY